MSQFTDAKREDFATISGGARYLQVPTTDTYCDGNVTRAYTAGATLAAKDIVILNTSSQWVLADANNAANLSVGLLGFVVIGGSSGETVTVALSGAIVKLSSASFTQGAYFLSETPGPGTTTRPTTGTSNQILAFYAPTTTTAHIIMSGYSTSGA